METTKRQRTTLGECSRSQNTVSEDMISQLPDEILIRILSSLSTDDTIMTSILGKRWRKLWKEIDHLSFDNNTRYLNNFGEYVFEAVFRHGNSDLQSLTIASSNHCEPFDLASWIQIAFLRTTGKFVLRLNNLAGPLTIPPEALQRRNRLKILKLLGNLNLNLSTYFVHFDFLIELHLYNVRFEDEVTVSRLLSGCPNLEELVVEIYISSGVPTLTIDMAKLRKLTLGIINGRDENIVVTAPCLNYLNIRCLDGVESCLFDNTLNIEEAKIAHIGEDVNTNILDITLSAQRLTLYSSIVYETGTVFHQLVYLELNKKDDGWHSLLFFMLNSSPRLQTLKLIGGLYHRRLSEWNPPHEVASCLLLSLHKLVWYDFVWRGIDDMNVSKYLLGNSPRLTNATFKTFVESSPERDQQRNAAMAELAATEKASLMCNLVFQDLTYMSPREDDDRDPDAIEFMY